MAEREAGPKPAVHASKGKVQHWPQIMDPVLTWHSPIDDSDDDDRDDDAQHCQRAPEGAGGRASVASLLK